MWEDVQVFAAGLGDPLKKRRPAREIFEEIVQATVASLDRLRGSVNTG